MSPSNHVWGVSAARDRVWGQVSGLRPSKAGKRLFLTLQAYIDESYDHPEGIFVLGGCIANVESWAAFSGEWETLLPYANLINKKGKYYFKMSDMAGDRAAKIPAFFNIIEDYVSVFISAKIDKRDLKNALSRITVPGRNIDWGELSDPYHISFRCLMDKFHLSRKEIEWAIPFEEKVDFYFDNQTQKKKILSIWDTYIKHRPPEMQEHYGATPRFEDDDEFLPLQAADLWAGWMRKWYKDGNSEKNKKPEFSRKKHPIIMISFDEDQLAACLKEALSCFIEAGEIICDAKFPA